MTEIEVESNRVYLILDGSKTVNKETFLKEISLLLGLSECICNDWNELSICLEKSFKANIIWIDPLDFSKYNSADFFVALDILKGVNDDESNPLQFALASYVKNINIDLYR